MNKLTYTVPQCILCSSKQCDKFAERGEYTYYKCNKCGGVFVSPLEEQINYDQSITYLTDPESYIKMIDPKGFRFFLEKLDHARHHVQQKQEKGSLLEIGAGVGYFAFMAQSRGWEVEALETSKPSADWAKKYLKLDIFNQHIEEFDNNKQYDATVLIEVLEHFRHSSDVMMKIKKLSKNGSIVLGSTPNIESNYWSTVRDILVPQDHIFLFSKQAIIYLFEKCGIELLELSTFGGDTGDGHLFFTGKITK